MQPLLTLHLGPGALRSKDARFSSTNHNVAFKPFACTADLLQCFVGTQIIVVWRHEMFCENFCPPPFPAKYRHSPACNIQTSLDLSLVDTNKWDSFDNRDFMTITIFVQR